jgi:hypothetical protein
MRRFRRYRGTLLLGVLLLAGCGTATTSLPTTPQARTATASASTVTRTEPAPPSAADGDDVAACLTGNCEVEVGVPGTIELAPPLTISVVLVETIGKGTVTLGVGPASLARFRLACSGGAPPCEAAQPLSGDNAGSATGGTGAVVTANELTIRVEAVTANSAIIRLSSAR